MVVMTSINSPSKAESSVITFSTLKMENSRRKMFNLVAVLISMAIAFKVKMAIIVVMVEVFTVALATATTTTTNGTTHSFLICP